jgi:hypothetical protein
MKYCFAIHNMQKNFAPEGTEKVDKEAGQVFPPPCFPLRGIRLT